MADRIGQQFGTYRLTRWLGRGGFAEVYLGEHIHLGTQAAIKVLDTQLTDENVQQFRMEARTIAQLDHANIVRLLDFDIKDDTPFLVMSYAPHGSLRTHHPRGTRLPLPTIVAYVKQAAAALHYAHALPHSVIHRDIKPENMLLGRNNEVLLSDFGLALVLQSSGSQVTNEAVGTVLYTAPEQLQGKPRKASDQYSLGIVVYEWLSGNCPFSGNWYDIAFQHMHVPPPSLHEKDPTIPTAVEEVVFIALAKDSQKRFATVQAFATALEQAVPDEMRQPTVEKPTTTDNLPPPEQRSNDSIYWTVRADSIEPLSSDPATDKLAPTPGNDQRGLPNLAAHHTPLQTVFLFNERLTDPSEFYGRVRERETLRNRTRKGASTSIVGPRRMGKTWLMDYLRLVVPTMLGSHFHVAYLDATTARCATVSGFTARVLEELGMTQFVPDSANRALALLERVIYS